MSGYLWSFGHKQAYNKFYEWFEKTFKINISSSRISRADICLDTDEIEFVESDIKSVVAKARKKVKYFVNGEYSLGRKFSGFTIGGGGSLMARIYNKSLEIKQSGKQWFEHIWRENGSSLTKDIWRVEFQLRRKILKEFDINTVEHLWSKLDRVWAYLTQDWLQLKQDYGDNNVSRRKVKRKWEIVQKAELGYKPLPSTREIIKMGDVNRLLDQAAGIGLSIAALAEHESIGDTVRVIETWIDMKLKKNMSSF